MSIATHSGECVEVCGGAVVEEQAVWRISVSVCCVHGAVVNKSVEDYSKISFLFLMVL